MGEYKEQIIVGVLGQWASGKSTAASTLCQYLGGEGQVIFLTDREIFAHQAVKHILELDESKVKQGLDEHGMQRIEGELVTIYLPPGETLQEVDLNDMLFDLHPDVYDKMPAGSLCWMDATRLELGRQIRASSAAGKPVVIEAGFGTNTQPRGENPFRNTLADLFIRLEEAGVGAGQVKWILIEASYETRAERNRKRSDTVRAAEFDRFAAEGGDLTPEQQAQWEAKGITIVRVPNEHDDIERFKDDIIAAFESLF